MSIFLDLENRPRCPICSSRDVDLDAEGRFLRCGACLRVYDVYNETCIWWPNDQGVEEPDWIDWPDEVSDDASDAELKVEGQC